MTSLKEFATSAPRKKTGYAPWLPSIPEYDQVVEAWKAGTPGWVIIDWLQRPKDQGGCGYEQATQSTVVVHLRGRYGSPRANTAAR